MNPLVLEFLVNERMRSKERTAHLHRMSHLAATTESPRPWIWPTVLHHRLIVLGAVTTVIAVLLALLFVGPWNPAANPVR